MTGAIVVIAGTAYLALALLFGLAIRVAKLGGVRR